MNNQKHIVRYKELAIDTNQELVAYMPAGCTLCKSEGFHALTRVAVSFNGKTVPATLNVTHNGLLHEGELGLSLSAENKLGLHENDRVTVEHLEPLNSIIHVRRKLNGEKLDQKAFSSIINDIVAEKYSNIYISAFVAACSGNKMSTEEICYLTRAMINAGSQLQWNEDVIADKHCIGGLPGNRTTLIVVPIIASLGIPIPKTSSKAITSPAGTADTMAVLTNVNLSLEDMQRMIRKEKGCIAWGGSIQLSPADDLIIKVEKALDIDCEGQMIASILSKKAATGSTHCVIDIPVGPTAKVKTYDAAEQLAEKIEYVADYIGMKVKIIFSDGLQPTGFGIGPSLEARDVLSVLKNLDNAPQDLRKRALSIASAMISMVWNQNKEQAYHTALNQLTSGKAYEKMIAICKGQGGFNEPKQALYSKTIEAPFTGILDEIDNRKLATLAKLAGAPDSAEAGVDFMLKLHQKVEKGQPMFTIHANTTGELDYACEYYRHHHNHYHHILKFV